MFLDEYCEPFNPFNIGPVESKGYNYVAASTPTYPPPVYATWPQPKEHVNRSVSRATMRKSQSEVLKKNRSLLGEVTDSNAINEEMSASKKQLAEEVRYHIGGKSKSSRSLVQHSSKSNHREKRETKLSSSWMSRRENAGGHSNFTGLSRRSQGSRSSFQPELTSGARSQSTIRGKDSRVLRPIHVLNRVTPSMKQVAESIKRDLDESTRLTQVLVARAAELSKRLEVYYN